MDTLQLIEQFGYVGLLIVSFLAATILPFSSEVLVVLMPALGFNKLLILLFATTGNFLGSLSNYYVGKLGNRFLLAKYVTTDNARLQQAQTAYERWGAPILFFSWVPIVGDPLTFVPGILNRKVSTFAFWVLLGKVSRYWFILWVVDFFSSS
ncbi:DedA family protein [Chloroflexi bacterium TSY]|nr:DedA family protein [Chloroflexi bacterium TSY]